MNISLGKEKGESGIYILLQKFQTKQFYMHLNEMAKLDRDLYTTLNELYQMIRVWEQFRNEIICSLAGETTSIVRSYFNDYHIKVIDETNEKALEFLESTHYKLLKVEINKSCGGIRANATNN